MTAASLAAELGADERTIRRAIQGGTIRARRSSPRRVVLPDDERGYLVGHWSTLQELRRALRTEPNVAAAILFGSIARGDDRPSSDLDLLVDLRRDSATEAALLEERLSRILGRSIQVTRASSAEKAPRLLLDVVADGRPVVDRRRYWTRLRHRAPELRRAVSREVERSADTLAREYGIELAA